MINQTIKEKQNVIYSMNRKYTPQNKNEFRDLMAQVDWTVLYNNQDTNSAFEVFHKKVTEIYNIAFLKVRIKSMCLC